jgi:hypothetical protein
LNKQSYKYYVLTLIAFILASCVPSVDNPYDINTDTDKDKPIIDKSNPVSGDSMRMGITSIVYEASDYEGGSAFSNEAQIIGERKLQTEFEFSEVKRLAPGTTTWTDQNGLYHILTLFYRLKTKYPQGDSEYSSELIVFIP